jgi:hypothetical protein
MAAQHLPPAWQQQQLTACLGVRCSRQLAQISSSCSSSSRRGCSKAWQGYLLVAAAVAVASVVFWGFSWMALAALPTCLCICVSVAARDVMGDVLWLTKSEVNGASTSTEVTAWVLACVFCRHMRCSWLLLVNKRVGLYWHYVAMFGRTCAQGGVSTHGAAGGQVPA